MGRYSIVICATFLMLALVHKGAAIQCYKCDGEDNCAHPQDHPSLIGNCSDSCVTRTEVDVNGTIFIRACGDRHACSDRVVVEGRTCYTCDTDLCNSSITLFPTLLINAILFIIVRYFF